MKKQLNQSVELTDEERQHSQLEINRRNFLVASALGLGGILLPNIALAGGSRPPTIPPQQPSGKPVLNCSGGVISTGTASSAPEAVAPCVVYIFLRGGMDGLSMVAPSKTRDLANYNIYKAARPDTALNDGIQLGTSKFMLNSRMEKLYRDVFLKNRLAVLQGAGSPNNTRSHFDQMNYIESGSPLTTGGLSKSDGFLNRILAASGANIQAASLQSVVPRNISGANPAVALNGSIDRFVQMNAAGVAPGTTLAERVIGMFSGLVDPVYCAPAAASSHALERAAKIVADANSWAGISPAAEYQPAGVGGGFAAPLRETVRLLKGSPGTRVVSIDIGGWDTHVNIGAQEGYFAGKMEALSHALATFQKDIEALGMGNRVVTVVMTEFGRTFHQNGSMGLDHGRGSAMLVMGKNVRGGVYARDWNLALLNEGRDLRVTIDYRDVLGQIVQRHLGANLASAFPGYALNTSGLVLI
jgi:uncharacterized protein (DUF1501 family)